MQNDVLSVLAAVAEVIKQSDGEETDVEYFSALLSALESSPPDQKARLTATAYLLKLIVKKVPKEILQKYFSRTLEVRFVKLFLPFDWIEFFHFSEPVHFIIRRYYCVFKCAFFGRRRWGRKEYFFPAGKLLCFRIFEREDLFFP